MLDEINLCLFSVCKRWKHNYVIIYQDPRSYQAVALRFPSSLQSMDLEISEGRLQYSKLGSS